MRRDISSRYSGTFVGAFWAIAQPVLMLAVYAFVFQRVFKIALPDLGKSSFVAFVACALWPWLAFQEGVMRGTQAIVSNRDLVRKVVFPYHLLVLSAVLSSFAIHFCGFVAVVMILALSGEPFQMMGLPVALSVWAVLAVMAYGLALFLSASQAIVKDVDHLLGPVFMLGFYVTPILYPLAMVPTGISAWMMLNPLVYLIEPMRAGLLGLGEVAWLPLGLLALLSCLLCWVGMRFFTGLARHFEDFF